MLDVSTSAPAVLSERYVEGSYQDARRHGEVVRMIASGATWQPQWGGRYPSYWRTRGGLVSRYDFYAAVVAWLDERLAEIRAQGLDRFLPDELVREGDVLVPVPPRCDAFFAPAPGQSSYGLVQVLTFRLDDPSTSDSTYVLGHASTIYASHDALVLAQDDWRWDLAWWSSSHRTVLHQFAIDGAETAYVGSGVIAGGVLNQFAIDEADGHLRVAVTEDRATTTDPDVWSATTSVNRIVTLRAIDGELVQIGSTPDLAAGERIFSARYVGDRGYLVTFRQVDPLFVIDLADPTAPAVLGEVEIPGFSTYMHPLSETHLLTIGRSADWGMQLQIFDVSDPTAPQRVQSHVIPNAYSAAEQDHKAFVFDPVSSLLAIPVEEHATSLSSTLRLFHVSVADGFTETGAIDHSALFGECTFWSPYDYYYTCGYSPSMRRGIFIDDFAYAISYGGLTVHATDALAPALATIDLPTPEITYNYYTFPGIGFSGFPGFGWVE